MDDSEAMTDSGVLALRQLIDEARAATPPEPNWDAVEAELMAKVSLEQTAARRHQPKSNAWGSLMVFAAAAAALVMVLANQGQPPSVVPSALQGAEVPMLVDVSTLPAQEREGELPTYMVAAMKPKSIVESGAEPMRFGLPGVATWVLAPHSRVMIDTVAMPHQITLEKGAVHAEVVPRHSSNEIIESFAVVAGTTRVAVHGTVFSVTRNDEQVTVEVTRGAVTVGPAGHRGLTTGRLLVSPARAAFSLHGGEFANSLPPSAPVAVAEAEPAEAGVEVGPDADVSAAGEPVDVAPNTTKRSDSNRAPSKADDADTAEPPAQPPLTADEARALVAACLSSRAKRTSSSDRLVTISSEVSVKTDDSGNVHTVRFNPPVKPSLGSSCGGVLFGRTTAGNSDLSFRVLVSK
jgi:ferric-dicitrate binding protein FerR (iron transport regulator)